MSMTPEEQARDFAKRCGWECKNDPTSTETGWRKVHEDDLTAAFLAYRQVAIGELTPDLTEILGIPNFRAGPIAHAFVGAGRAEIKSHAEEEQAFVLHWLLGLYLKHGTGWRLHANAELNKVIDEAKAKTKPAEPAPAE